MYIYTFIYNPHTLGHGQYINSKSKELVHVPQRRPWFAIGWRNVLLTYQKLTATDNVSIVKGCFRIKNPPKKILFSPKRRAFK